MCKASGLGFGKYHVLEIPRSVFTTPSAAGEKEGLLKDANGDLVLEGGCWKVLDCEVTEPELLRADGQPEYRHEATLFKTYAEVFANLNPGFAECFLMFPPLSDLW